MSQLKKGSGRYWEQVVDAQPNKEKPERIREVVAEMKAKGEKSVPTELAKIIKATMSLAENFT